MAVPAGMISRTPTYHDTEAGYILPNDPAEHKRLIDQSNALVALMKDRIIHAPLTNPRVILDMGCGTGIITRYFALRFPTAQVYGIDLCPVPSEPTDVTTKNLTFIKGNFRKSAGRDERLQWGSLDYFFSRLLLDGMTDWPGYVKDAYKMLRPGTWAELSDYVEDCFYEDNRIVPREAWPWQKAIREGGFKQGLDLDAGWTIKRYMEDAGFVNIQRWEYRVPYWRGALKERPEATRMTEHAIGDRWGLYWHMIPKLVEPLGLSEEVVDGFRRDAVRDLGEEEGKYQVVTVTIGRKPETSA
ncbi:hypothetical protein N7G274_003421 [Stereocaulon virgatum]|uniref:S-adenosyl-L-methionine-dependent methyltransferase n=1 Tax=Stereocaulon virgatum TaxID=373712 RepID=A0ABR4AEJ4_9LECA